ncbi:hypothetical protein Ciccas_007534 [Cichlidogyrus casuarinus]|uniref:BZIP domain-containing protein n=1 Tax=Cichlidogyrus casuarinus TaxID=1844966 RepID=A0ABD2Q2N2_9PLAT
MPSRCTSPPCIIVYNPDWVQPPFAKAVQQSPGCGSDSSFHTELESSASRLTFSSSENISPELNSDCPVLDLDQLERLLPSSELENSSVDDWLSSMDLSENVSQEPQIINLQGTVPLVLAAKDLQPTHIIQLNGQLLTTGGAVNVVDLNEQNAGSQPTIILLQTAAPVAPSNTITADQTPNILLTTANTVNRSSSPAELWSNSSSPEQILPQRPKNANHGSFLSVLTHSSSFRNLCEENVVDMDEEDNEFINTFVKDLEWKESNVIQQLAKWSNETRRSRDSLRQSGTRINESPQVQEEQIQIRRRPSQQRRKRPSRFIPDSSDEDEDAEVTEEEPVEAPPKRKRSRPAPKDPERERRIKNNEASRKSRAAKKMKLEQMADESEELALENRKLSELYNHLAFVVEDIRELLVEGFNDKKLNS